MVSPAGPVALTVLAAGGIGDHHFGRASRLTATEPSVSFRKLYDLAGALLDP